MGNRESKTTNGIHGYSLNPAQIADEADLLKNIKEIRQLMVALDSFNYKVQIGNPDLGEEVRQGAFVASNRAAELAEMLSKILELVEKDHDY